MPTRDNRDLDNIIGPPGSRASQQRARNWEVYENEDPKRAQGGGGCWIVTAYYGDQLHPDVCRIRALRAKLYEIPLVSSLVRLLNVAYQVLGRMQVGKYWRERVLDPNSSFARPITGVLCRTLLLLTNLVKGKDA